MGRWKRFLANREHVTGAFTGTTAQIIRWAACKWGLDPNLLDAVAEQESGWQMHDVGDRCGPKGEASYGLFQIKNAYCNGGGAWGGYPATAQDTALNADFYAAYLRSCLDNDFDNGGQLALRRPVGATVGGRAWVCLRRLGLRRLVVFG